MIRIFEGIKYIHSNHFIYRDLKPSNIFLNHDFVPFIGDFDSVKDIDNSEFPFTGNIGSDYFTSPEQYQKDEYSYPTDIFSFGCIVYFLFSNGKNVILKDKYCDLMDNKIPKLENITSNIQNLFLSCMKLNPSERITLENIEKLIEDDLISDFYIEQYLKQNNELNINEIIQYLHESMLFAIKNRCNFNLFLQYILNYELISLLNYIENKKTSSRHRFSTIGIFYYEMGGNKQNLLKAKKYFKLAAKQNDLAAHIYLGYLYLYGFETNYLKAKEHFEIAADKGHFDAQCNLGIIYLYGYGVKQDYLKAKKYFVLAANKDHPNAQYMLGVIYYSGFGIKKDYSKAKEYFELASNQNHLEAKYMLGIIYFFGFGTKKDYSRANKYFELAANQNLPDAQYFLAVSYFNGYGVKQDYLKAIEYFESASNQNHSEAQYNLGIIYSNGYGVKQDYLKSKEYFELAANENLSQAQNMLGIIYYHGLGVEQDYLKAKEYFELAANENLSVSQVYLGIIYYKGLGVKQDFQKANEYFELAAKQNNPDDLIIIGKTYLFGSPDKKNTEMAMKYFNIAAKQNNIDAYMFLLIIYQIGYGTEDDYLKAKNFFLSIKYPKDSKVLSSLGLIYFLGIGAKKDYSKAANYFKSSLKHDNNNVIALYYLFYIYFLGLETPQSFSIAIDYLKSFMQILHANSTNFFEIVYESMKYIDFKQFMTKLKKIYQLKRESMNSNNNNEIFNIFLNEFIKFQNSIKFFQFGQTLNEKWPYQLMLGAKKIFSILTKNVNKINFKKYLPELSFFFEKNAELQEPYSLNILGVQYYYGFNVEKNYEKAKNYFELSAKQNDSFGFLHLGHFYMDGYACPKDYLKARQYFEESVKLNNTIAMIYLGRLYQKGLNTKQDYGKTYEYYKLAADNNDSDGLYYLGNLYLKGLGVEKNPREAIKFFEKASQKNNPKAFIKLGIFYSRGIIVPRDYLLAKQYFGLASLQNNPSSFFYLGDLLSNGEYFDVDLPKAIDNFQKCSEIENKVIIAYEAKDDYFLPEYRPNKYRYRSFNDLGLIYIIFYKDAESATDYLKASAFGEYPFGQNNFGVLSQFYLNSIENAKYMYERASKHNFAPAEYNLGHLFESQGLVKESIEQYTKASEDEDQPLVFQGHNHYDERLEVSKTFIVCLANLKLTKHYCSTSDYAKAKQYFIKSFAKIISNDANLNYQFKFNADKDDVSYYLKNFIFNFPKFNFINQQKLFEDLEINDIQLTANTDSKFKFQLTKTNDKMIPNAYSLADIIEEKQIRNNKYFEMFKKNHFADFDKNNNIKAKEIQKNIQHLNTIFLNVNESRQGNHQDQINDIKEPGDLFDKMIQHEETKISFIESLNDLIQTMSKVLHMPPYQILFGRIYTDKYDANRKRREKEENNNCKLKDINDLFYEVFAIDLE
ncbi:hypothetical protein M9Y10_034051 [Tritrichomonas musculus]|uniref:Protein kinase domain-containing protein n=1 Tax=Tritrichomonas musculus TaxID=1915356 RepID=A0ABR2KDU3_9EUKA